MGCRFFLPVVTTTAAYNGFFNEILLALNVIDQPYDWIGSVDTALMIVIAVGLWKTFGMNLLYWLAGLQSLPTDIYEEAKIDGANAFQSFRHTTVPLLVPVGSVILLLTVVGSLHAFDLVKKRNKLPL